MYKIIIIMLEKLDAFIWLMSIRVLGFYYGEKTTNRLV
jgi:hypothetical protein